MKKKLKVKMKKKMIMIKRMKKREMKNMKIIEWKKKINILRNLE